MPHLVREVGSHGQRCSDPGPYPPHKPTVNHTTIDRGYQLSAQQAAEPRFFHTFTAGETPTGRGRLPALHRRAPGAAAKAVESLNFCPVKRFRILFQ
jgi:hypothetical protein